MIRVLVAEDSPTASALIVAMLEADPGIKVIAQAATGAEAVEMAARFAPDLITMDVQMPVLDGLQATERIMRNNPCPIIIVTSQARESDVRLSLDATRAGAMLVLSKPEGPASTHFAADQRQLVSMVKALAGVKVVRRWRGGAQLPSSMARQVSAAHEGSRSKGAARARVVAIATSTGGPAALRDLLAVLPAEFPAPILIVQHISKGFVDGLVKWIAADSKIAVKVAVDGEVALPGTAYIAADGYHLELQRGHSDQFRIALTLTPPVGSFRPSATRLFASVATAAGKGALAVILTGMGDDGVAGLREIQKQQGTVIAQDEASSVIYGMPREAVRAGVVNEVVSLQNLPGRLTDLT